MTWPFRVTPPLLDIVQTLTEVNGRAHGWDLAERSGQSGPNTYRVLERLRSAGWVDYEWETKNPAPGKPRRRFYWFTDHGLAQAPRLLAERRDRHSGIYRAPGLTLLGVLAMIGWDAR
jgi:DNA-binding PadR family transcriptional regulator